MFHEAVHFAHNVYELPLSEVLGKVVTVRQAQEVQDSKKANKLDFLTNHLKFLADKQYTTADYCFAVESFPHCNYDILRSQHTHTARRKEGQHGNTCREGQHGNTCREVDVSSCSLS
ncbi:hypothetical protein ACOMHN_007502 [Nucella lapillus]